MCILLNKLKQNQKTGYKLAIKDGNQYYSPATGTLIKIGVVKPVNKIDKSHGNTWLNGLDKSSAFYNNEMVGRTSIFINKEDAIKIINGAILKGLVLLKCVISTDLMDGYVTAGWAKYLTIAGRNIKSFEEIKI